MARSAATIVTLTDYAQISVAVNTLCKMLIAPKASFADVFQQFKYKLVQNWVK